MTDKTPNNIWKWTWALITISIATNFLFMGYILTGGDVGVDTSESTIYQMVMQDSGVSDSVGNLNQSSTIDVDDLTSRENEDGFLLDKWEAIARAASVIKFATAMILVGSLTNINIAHGMVSNPFVAFLLTMVLGFANIIWFILIFKFVRRGFKTD